MLNKSTAVKILMFFLIAILSGSCKKNCSSVVCHTYGYNPNFQTTISEVCYNGNCGCPNGLEGDSCQLYSVNKYVQPTNTWQVYDACSGSSTYSVYMTPNLPSYSDFYINNFFNSGTQLHVFIVSSGHQGVYLNVPAQQTSLGAVNGGTGLYQANGSYGRITMTLDYTANSTGIETSCNITMNQY